jgi:hypothetical protein
MNAHNVRLTFSYRPTSDTAMVWTDIVGSDEDRAERSVREPVGDNMIVEMLKYGPSHNRTGLIFDGLSVIDISNNDGWDAFLGLLIGDQLTSVIVDKIKELRSLPMPIDIFDRIRTNHRIEANVDLTALVVS